MAAGGLWLAWLLAPVVAGSWVRLGLPGRRPVVLALGGIVSLAAFGAPADLASRAAGLYWLSLLAPLGVGGWIAWKCPPALAAAGLGLLGGALFLVVGVRLTTTTCYFGPFRESSTLARTLEEGLKRGTSTGPARVDASGALVVEVLVDTQGEGLLERFRLLGPPDGEGFRPGPLLRSVHQSAPGDPVVEPARVLLPRAPDGEGYDLRVERVGEFWDVKARYRLWQDGRRFEAPFQVRVRARAPANEPAPRRTLRRHSRTSQEVGPPSDCCLST